MVSFCSTVLSFLVTFTPLTFSSYVIIFVFHSQVSTTELKWRKFTTKSQMKSAPNFFYLKFLVVSNSL